MIERNEISLTALLTDEEKRRIGVERTSPTLALYRVAHEGISSGVLEGLGPAPKRWSAGAVRKLADALGAKRVPVYRGHGNFPRQPVGYVVKCFTIVENGKTSAFALVHITDAKAEKEALMKKLDTASVEADVELEAGEGAWEVTDVSGADAVAVAESSRHKPGFELAELIAASKEKPDGSNTRRVDAREELVRRLASLNLTDEERGLIARITAERAKDNDAESIHSYAQACLDTLNWARTAYRRRKGTPIPVTRKKFGAPDYSDPDYNELIPQFKP